jgi:HAD superfamily hydrolase (TIGR01450 family)
MKKEEILQRAKAIVLDLDGTVYLDETPIGDMANTLSTLRKMGKRIVYLTNSSSKTEAEYREKLVRLGLWDEHDVVYTSAMSAIEYLAEKFEGVPTYVLATDSMKEQFREGGVNVVETGAKVCVLAYDHTVTYEKLQIFNEYLQQDTFYIATHTDLNCPTETYPKPDLGSFIALFQASCGRAPDLISGKPGKIMAECISRRLNLPCEEMCMIGDRLYTDIRFGNVNGMATVLVLTGEARMDNLSDYPDVPDLILPSLNDLIK